MAAEEADEQPTVWWWWWLWGEGGRCNARAGEARVIPAEGCCELPQHGQAHANAGIDQNRVVTNLEGRHEARAVMYGNGDRDTVRGRETAMETVVQSM